MVCEMIQEQQNQQKNAASTGKSCSKGKYNVYFVQGMIGLDTNTVNHLAPELNPPPPPPTLDNFNGRSAI